MKRVFSLIALAVVAAAQAQTPEEDRILAGIAKLRDESQLYLYLEGTDTLGGVTSTFKSHLYWQTQFTDTKQTTRFQLLLIQDDQVIQRIVGNGETAYSYNLRAREYSAANYGGYGTARPLRYAKDAVEFLNNNAKGQATWLTRMLREIHGQDTAVYRSWMPGTRPTQLPDGATQDPVWSDRTYFDTPTTDYIMYNGAPRRSIVFELQDDAPSETYRLSNVFFHDRSKLGTKDRFVQWKLTPYKGITFDERNFQPYTKDEISGWKPVVGSAPVKG